MSKLTHVCKVCGRKAKRLAEYLGFPNLCTKHMRMELGKGGGK